MCHLATLNDNKYENKRFIYFMREFLRWKFNNQKVLKYSISEIVRVRGKYDGFLSIFR